MNLVMDANALIACVVGEPGGRLVDDIMMAPENDCFVHAVNLCEVYYEFVCRTSQVEADTVLSNLFATGLLIREDMDTRFWQEAGTYKAELARISLADCFCVTLARRLGAELVTADRHELEAILERNLCPVRFIR